MKDHMAIVDGLLEKDSFIIDFFPQTVPKNSDGSFFDVEYYLLYSEKHAIIKDRLAGVIYKIMCYYNIAVFWNGWIEKPNPRIIDEAISEIMTNHSGTLNVIFPDENALLIFEWDCLNLTVYNPSEEMQHIFEQVVLSEGLFWRPSA